jgi:cytochrome c peroxidase
MEMELTLQILKSPSLRDLVKADGSSNGAFMHTANLNTFQNVIGHYGSINLARKYQSDPRLRPNGFGQN